MTASRPYRIALLPGDGIGLEVAPAAARTIDVLAERHGFSIAWETHDWGSDHYRAHGRMMPSDALDTLRTSDAIFLGAVGDPEIPDAETLWGMLIPIRRAFDQYVNLRPMRCLPGIDPPVRGALGMDVVIVRENVEGEYSEIGGRIYTGTSREMAMQEAVFTRVGIERVTSFALRLAQQRSGRLVSATKSNGIVHTMPFWDEVVAQTALAYPDVTVESHLIDALAAHLVLRPASFDVIVGSNLFGDILSDLTAAIAGSIGIAPSANLNPERTAPSMFEPVHGTAPDIAGQGKANPIGQMWAGAMMLEHLGETTAAAELIAAFEAVLASGSSTADLGGTCTTDGFTHLVIERCRSAV